MPCINPALRIPRIVPSFCWRQRDCGQKYTDAAVIILPVLHAHYSQAQGQASCVLCSEQLLAQVVGQCSGHRLSQTSLPLALTGSALSAQQNCRPAGRSKRLLACPGGYQQPADCFSCCALLCSCIIPSHFHVRFGLLRGAFAFVDTRLQF